MLRTGYSANQLHDRRLSPKFFGQGNTMKNKIPPPVLLLISGAIMWFVANSSYAGFVTIPYALPASLLLAAAGIGIAAIAIRQFRLAETTVNPLQPDAASALVDGGLFSKTRNPMYLGLLLVLLGWAVWLQSLSNLLVIAGFVLYLTELQIKPEEAALGKIFGDAYADYCVRVRRWI
jgi:protein-S-isoprenylcysteine O-methyltransferase Ste14